MLSISAKGEVTERERERERGLFSTALTDYEQKKLPLHYEALKRVHVGHRLM